MFENAECEIPLVEKALYERISDKYAFSQLCREHGIGTPKEYSDLSVIDIPCVAKPKKCFSTDGSALIPVIIHTDEDLRPF